MNASRGHLISDLGKIVSLTTLPLTKGLTGASRLNFLLADDTLGKMRARLAAPRDVLSKTETGARLLSVPTLHIRRSAISSADATRLIAALNAELTATFPEPGANHFSLSETQVTVGEGAFMIAYLDGVAVGCGAVRRLDEATAELKRMYVDPSVRGRGIGRALVEALEGEARLLGVTKVVLETGTRLAPAIKLYEAMGHAPIPLFGEYQSSPDTSLCFGKSLA